MSKAGPTIATSNDSPYEHDSPNKMRRHNVGITERTKVLGWQILEPRARFWLLAKACFAELVGTGLFVFLATGVVTSGCHTRDVAASSGNGSDTSLTNVRPGSCFLSNTSTLLNIALAFGFSLFVVIYFTASFSGGHVNPAVSLAMFLARKISLMRFILYTIFQCSGAAIGSIVLKGLDHSGFKAAGGAANQVNKENGVTPGAALGFEIVLTFALVFTVFAATDSERAISTTPLPILAPFSIGMVVFVCHLVGIPIDGTSVNPARSFGPAMVARVFNYYWIFWVGPFVGGAVAALMYELAFRTWQTEKTDPATATEDVEAGVPIGPTAERPVHVAKGATEAGAPPPPGGQPAGGMHNNTTNARSPNQHVVVT